MVAIVDRPTLEANISGQIRVAGIAPGLGQRLPLYLAWVAYGGLLVSALTTWALLPVEAGGFMPYITRQDFVGVYLGAHLIATGHSAQLYDLAAQYQLQNDLMTPYAPLVHILYFTYPGWIALLLAPLGALPYATAFLTWTGLNLVAAGVSIERLVRATARTLRERSLMLLVAAGFMPVWYALWQGQTPIIVLLGLVGALISLRAGKDGQAGAWLVLGLIKPQLIALPVLALLLARRWRALVALVVGGLLLLAASLLALGNWIPGYLDMLTNYVRTGATVGDDPTIMHNWRGLVFRLLGTDSGPVAGTLVSGLTLLSVGLAVAVCWPRKAQSSQQSAGYQWTPGWEMRFSVAILLGLLVNPHLYLHDAVIALVPGFVLWRAASGADIRLRLLRGVLLAGPFVARLALSWAPPVVEIGSWYLVLLLGTVLWAWPALGNARPTK